MTPRGGYIKDTPTLHRRCPKKGSGGYFGEAVLRLMELGLCGPRLIFVVKRRWTGCCGGEALLRTEGKSIVWRVV